MRTGRHAVAAALLLVAPAACSGEPAEPGREADPGVATGDALHVGDAAYALCVPTPRGQDVLLGDTLLTNQADGPVTLLGVELVGARALELVDAYAVQPLANPEGGSDLVGLRWAKQVDDLPADWREPAVGRALASGESVNLVLHLTETAQGGRLRAARIEYEHAGRRFQQQTLTSLAATPGRCDGDRPVPPSESGQSGQADRSSATE